MKKLLVIIISSGIVLVSCQSEASEEGQIAQEQQQQQEIEASQQLESTLLQQADSTLSEPIILENEEGGLEPGTYSPMERVDFQELLPKTQQFVIDPNRDTILKTQSNLELFIPAQSLVDKGGKPANGDIVFEVTEYLSYFDMVAGNLYTATKDEPLASAGMFKLAAYDGKNELRLKAHREIILNLPNAVDSAMKVYYAVQDQDQSLVWQVDPVSRNPYPYAVCYEGRYSQLTQFYFEDEFRFSKSDMIALVGDSIQYSLTFDEKGRIIGNKVCKDNANESKDLACNRFLKVSKYLTDSFPGTFDASWETPFSFKFMTDESYLDYREDQKKRRKEFEAKLRAQKDFDEVQLAKALVLRKETPYENFYRQNPVFFIKNLGLINMDKPLTLPEIPKSELLVKRYYHHNGVELLLNNQRTYLRPTLYNDSTFVFRGLPRNASATLISTYKKDGIIYFASQQVKLRKGREVLINKLNFKKLSSLDELKGELNAI